MQEGSGSITEGLTSVVESGMANYGVLFVVPDTLHSEVSHGVTILPDETGSFLSGFSHVDLAGRSAVTVVHGALEDVLHLIVVFIFLLPDEVLLHMIIKILRFSYLHIS